MKKHLRSHQARIVLVVLVVGVVAAVAVPTAAFGKRDVKAGSCTGMTIKGFSPHQGPVGTRVTVKGSHLGAENYLNTFFPGKNGDWIWVHHSDEDLSMLGQGILITEVPDGAISGRFFIRDGEDCEFAYSPTKFKVTG